MGKEQAEVKKTYAFNHGEPLTQERLGSLLEKKFGSNQFLIRGEIGVSGVVIRAKKQDGSAGHILAAIRHPKFIPVHVGEGEAVFNGPQTDNMIEYWHFVPFGERAKDKATEIFSQHIFPTTGEELEAFTHDGATGQLVPADPDFQIETQRTISEISPDGTKLPRAAKTPQEAAVVLAEMILLRETIEAAKGHIAIETSVPIGGIGDIRTSEALANPADQPYIQAMTHIFPEFTAKTYDPRVEQVLDAIAHLNGFDSFENFQLSLPFERRWIMASSHLNKNIGEEQQGQEVVAPEEFAIAIADLIKSKLGALADIFTQSTPLFAGKTGGSIIEISITSERRDFAEQTVVVGDIRTLYKLMQATAQEGPFIETPEEMYERMERAIINGYAPSLARTAYLIEWDEQEYASMHECIRVRGDGPRIEFVGGSSTPNILGRLARNEYITILMFAALEAVAQGQHPKDYFKAKFGDDLSFASEWKGRQELTFLHALYETDSPEIQLLLEQNERLLTYMEKYDFLKPYIAFVKASMKALQTKPDEHIQRLDAYRPNTSFLSLIKRLAKRRQEDAEFAKELPDAEIIRQLNTITLEQAHMIINYQGNFEKLIKLVA